MAGYAHINRCAELAEGDISSALEDRRLAKALLDRLARVARPGEGAPKMLHFLARLAGREVDWIEGVMRVEVLGEGDGVSIEVLSDLGAGMQERLFPTLKVAAPFKEFSRMVEHMPRTLEPLVAVKKSANRLVLEAASEGPLRTSVPVVAIADDSLYRARRTSRPKVLEKADTPPPVSARSGSSGKQRAVGRHAPSEPEAPLKISPRTGNTLRPGAAMAPAPARNKTLVPNQHAVPPPIPAVPQAPRVPRVDSSGPRRGIRPSGQMHKVTPPTPPPPEPAPRAKKTSRPKVETSAAETKGSRSSAKHRAARLDSQSDDLDWDMPAADTLMPAIGRPPSSHKGTLLPADAVPPPIPAMPPARVPRVDPDDDVTVEVVSVQSARPKPRRAKKSPPPAKNERGVRDPRADEDDDE